jgi:hypothetical protein
MGVADPPLMTLVACRASSQDPFVADAQQCVEFAVDADIDKFAGVWAAEVQAFHRGPPSVAASSCLAKHSNRPSGGDCMIWTPALDTIVHLSVTVRNRHRAASGPNKPLNRWEVLASATAFFSPLGTK